MWKTIICRAWLSIALLLAGAGSSPAAPYPSKPVMIITPSPAGAGPDVIARIVAEHLSRRWRQQVLVVNRPGAGGLLAADAAVAATPDGYTLYMALSSTFLVLPEMQPHLRVNLERDVAPIGLIAEQPMIITVNSSLGVNTLQELVLLSQQRPGDLLFGAGRGFLPHLTGALFNMQSGAKLRYVPYSSTAKAMQDAMGGTLNVFFEALSALSGPINAGSLKPLAVASMERLPNYPSLPTATQALPALGRFEASGWFVLMAPARTPPEIVGKLSEDLRSVLSDRDATVRFAALGTYPHYLPPADTLKFIRDEQNRWQPIVRRALEDTER
jgi:tripartite-type tricarboxylate transporter receptor subunit TctC